MMAELKHSDHKSSRFCSLKVNMSLRYIYNKGKSGESSTVVQSQDVNYFNTKATKLRNHFTLASFNLIVDTIK